MPSANTREFMGIFGIQSPFHSDRAFACMRVLCVWGRLNQCLLCMQHVYSLINTRIYTLISFKLYRYSSNHRLVGGTATYKNNRLNWNVKPFSKVFFFIKNKFAAKSHISSALSTRSGHFNRSRKCTYVSSMMDCTS